MMETRIRSYEYGNDTDGDNDQKNDSYTAAGVSRALKTHVPAAPLGGHLTVSNRPKTPKDASDTVLRLPRNHKNSSKEPAESPTGSAETRILCQSPKVATYDLKPEMSAYEITESIIPEIEKGDTDFICLNFANPDMVGHTGDMSAAIKACETVDECSAKIIEKAKENKYTVLVIADHGNSDIMINKDGSPNTAHTTNLVPLILIDKEIKKIENGVLGDIAPSILDIMNIQKPEKMTCKSLIVH